MQQRYFVRLGKWGEIWLGESTESLDYARGTRVICRTGRGLELGEIVSAFVVEPTPESFVAGPTAGPSSDGPVPEPRSVARHDACRIVRCVTAEDALLEDRLQRHKQAAVRECQSELRKRGLPVTLMDVEHLFDGRTLIFHFAGELTGEVQHLVDDLTNVYEQRSRSREFAKLLSEGCGPGCGTDTGKGCGGQGGCAVCLVAGACSSRS